MKLLQPHSIFGRFTAIMSVLALGLSLGWSAEHCVTFDQGAQVLKAAAAKHSPVAVATQSHAHHQGHHFQPSALQETDPSDSHAGHHESGEEETEAEFSHCNYCQAATGSDFSFAPLPILAHSFEGQPALLQEVFFLSQSHSFHRGRAPPAA